MNYFSIDRCVAELERVRDTYEAVETFNKKAQFTADKIEEAIGYIEMLEDYNEALQIITGAAVFCAVVMFGLLFLI